MCGSADYKVSPEEWSLLLWQGEVVPNLSDPKTFNKGFLKVMLLVKVCHGCCPCRLLLNMLSKVLRMVLLGTKKSTGTSSLQGGCTSRMKSCKITIVTIPMIAWAATLVSVSTAQLVAITRSLCLPQTRCVRAGLALKLSSKSSEGKLSAKQ